MNVNFRTGIIAIILFIILLSPILLIRAPGVSAQDLNNASLSVGKATYVLGETVCVSLAAAQEEIVFFNIISPEGIFYAALPSTDREYKFKPDIAGTYVVNVLLRTGGDEKFLTTGFEVIDTDPEVVFGEPKQGAIELGEPVNWSQHISITNHGRFSISNFSVSIPLPAGHSNLSSDAGFSITNSSIPVDLAAGEDVSFNISYQTPPVWIEVVEEALVNGTWRKEMVIGSNASVHYRDVTAFTPLNETAGSNIKLFLLENGSRVDVTDDPAYNVSLRDKNRDSISDEIRWNVPLLSLKRFEVEYGYVSIRMLASLTSKRGHFGPDEAPEFIFKYMDEKGKKKALMTAAAEKESIKTFVYNYKGELTDIEPEIEYLGGGTFSIKLPRERAFRAGLYNLIVELLKEEHVYVLEDEFLWGMVSLNTRKSIYKPGETAEFMIVALDNDGRPVCNADISLTVSNPDNEKTTNSTADGTIITSNECGIYNATHLTEEEGNHTLDLTAIINGIEVNFSTYFLVQQDYEFDIIRTAQSKIDPTKQDRFDVKLDIESFIGANSITIKEFVPAEFDVSTDAATVLLEDDTKTITWSKELIDDKTSVSYSYTVPHIWPYLYALGPVEMDYDSKSFTEARSWYVAADPIQFLEVRCANNTLDNVGYAYEWAHHKWEPSGRTFYNPATDKYMYTSYIGQTNVKLENGDYAPYVWDPVTKTAKFADCELRFFDTHFEFWRNGGQLINESKFKLYKKVGENLENIPLSFDSLKVNESDEEYGTVTLKLTDENKNEIATNIRFGLFHHIVMDFEVKVNTVGEYRIEMENSGLSGDVKEIHSGTGIKGLEEREDKITGVAYEEMYFHWSYDEAPDRLYSITKVIVELGSLSPGNLKFISPDQWGTTSIADDADDGEEDGRVVGTNQWKTGGYYGDGANFLGYYGAFDSPFEIGWRWDNIVASGTAEDGCKIEIWHYDNHTESGTSDSTTLYGIDEADPTIFSNSSLPSTRTMTSAGVTWNPSAETTDGTHESAKSPEIKTIVQELLDSYTYTGTQATAFHWRVESTSTWWRNYDDYSCIGGTPAKLTIVYTDTTPPSIYFVDPTPANGTNQSETLAYINVTVSDASQTSSFIDWNSSLVGYWASDWYNSTGIFDNSTYNNFGTFNGGFGTANITDGKYGRALEFDGSDDYIDCGNDSSININYEITIEAWVKTTSTAHGYFVSKGTSWSEEGHYAIGQEYNTPKTVQFEMCGSGGTVELDSNVTVNDGNWHHIVGTYNDPIVKIYVDGVERNSGSFADGLTGSTVGGLTIGKRGGNIISGTIDEVRIYTRVLSPEEINASYNNGLYRLYYNFTSLSEGTYDYYAYAIDTAGNANKTGVRTVTVDTTPPTITWEYPTPDNDTTTSNNWVFLNTTITNESNTSAFFDWNYSLVGYWAMDWYNSTGIYGNSTYNNFGSFGGGLSESNITTGKFGKALKFDGSDDYVEIGTTGVSASEGTVELWAKASGFSAAHHYFFGHTTTPVWTNRIQLYTDDEAGNLDLGLGDNHTRATNIQDLDVGVWYHIVLTWDGINYVVYVDGISKASGTYTGLTSIHSFADIGNDGNAGTRNEALNGTIDEVRIYNRVLSPEEINASYNNGLHRLYHNFTSLSEGTYDYYAYAIDTAGNANKTGIRTVTVGTTPPTYSNDEDDSGGSVSEGTIVNVSVYWDDNVALGKGVMRTNKTGAWQNETWHDFSATPQWFNTTIDTSGYGGETICWVQWANDTSNSWNTSMSTTVHCFDVSYSTTLEIRNQNNVTVISSINFSGESGDAVCKPYNNVDGSGSPQDITSNTPVVTIYNPSSSTNYKIWLKVTNETGWDNIISDEKFNVTADGVSPGDVSSWATLTSWGSYKNSGVTVSAGTHKDLYLAFYLKGSGTGSSMLSVLGEAV